MAMTKRNWTGAQSGFTLVELLVVIAILGILAGVVSFSVIRHIDDARVTRATLQIGEFKTAIQKYYIDVGQYPPADQGLKALIEAPSDEKLAKYWKGPYLETEQIPQDPWRADYIYLVPGGGTAPFEVISLGKDGAQGGEGNNADISSRKLSE